MQDEWGRHLSPDGMWVWDGTQWQPRQQPQPQVQPVHAGDQGQPWEQPGWGEQPVMASAAPVAAAAPAAGDGRALAALEAEVQSYPRLWRIARQGVLSIATLLEPGEYVEVTAPGSGDLIAPALALLTAAATAQRSMIVVATDRRLLFCQLTVTSRDVARHQGLRYEDVESWYVRKRFLHVQGKGVSATPNQMIKDKLLQLRTVVEPRLVNATFDVK